MFYCALIVVVAIPVFSIPTSANELEIVDVRVGQGDATLILGPPDANGERVTVPMEIGMTSVFFSPWASATPVGTLLASGIGIILPTLTISVTGEMA